MTDTEASKYVKLIYYVMKDYPNYPNKEDLYQAGWLGLLKAELLYDESYHTKFSTYAYPSIKGEMARLVEKDRPMKINRDLMKLNLKLGKIKVLLTQQLMREPTNQELANFIGCSEEEIIEAIAANEPVGSIHYSIISDSKDLTMEDTIPAPLEDIDARLDLETAINKLSEEEKILLAYNMTKTQNEIGKIVNMSQVKVSRRLTKIKSKVKKEILEYAS